MLFAVAGCVMAAEPGFEPIFNGKDLNDWTLVKGKGPGYLVKNGVIFCPADGGGNLFTKKEFNNFILRLEYKLTAGANNGVGIRAPLTGDVAYSGMEIQVLDDGDKQYQPWLKPWQYNGSIYNVVPAKQCCKKPLGEWNQEEIVADGRHIKITLNGTVIVDANLDDVKDEETLKKHPGLARTGGHIGLLGHGTEVEFRNMRVKELK